MLYKCAELKDACRSNNKKGKFIKISNLIHSIIYSENMLMKGTVSTKIAKIANFCLIALKHTVIIEGKIAVKIIYVALQLNKL